MVARVRLLKFQGWVVAAPWITVDSIVKLALISKHTIIFSYIRNQKMYYNSKIRLYLFYNC